MFRAAAICALVLLMTGHLAGQCSDAGACSIGGMDHGVTHMAGVRYAFGTSGKADDLTFHTVEVEASLALFADSRLSATLPWVRGSGPAGSVSGIGDLTILWHQPVLEAGAGRLSVQAGMKLASGRSNSGGLPQAYQPGLGTHDVLMGAAFETGPWTFAAGYQFSRGRSDNSVTRLRRGDDVMLRAGWQTPLGDVAAGLDVIAIKRLHLSSVLVPGTATFTDVPGSDQFQVNIVPAVSYPLTGGITLRAAAAVPLMKREVNVDGLTRSLTLQAGVQAAL